MSVSHQLCEVSRWVTVIGPSTRSAVMNAGNHIVPLVCGGPDTAANFRWQTIRDARG
jgi:hypothetical protein